MTRLLPLRSGFTRRSGLALLLALAVAGPTFAQAPRLEAEDAELFGADVATVRPGYSGTGYVTGFDPPADSVRFTVQGTGEFVAVRLAAASGVRVRSYTVWIDGEPIAGTFILSAAFQERTVVERRLAPGPHTVTVQGSFDLDYLTVAAVSYPPPADPPPVLADPAATAATRSLFAFLLDEYGRHVLSGQQDVYGGSPRLSEIPFVENATGREPAIGSFDLIDFSPTRVVCGARTAGWAQRWIDWSRTDAEGNEGIVNLMWHWNAPTDLYDTDCNGPDEQGTNRNWYSGFYTEATSFNFAEALDPQSPNHGLLLRDIDALAVPLRQFRDANVPVIWRPLHEAAGGFFWWGAQGGADYVRLWRLVYDRLTTVHDLHNLIWVWTQQAVGPAGGSELDWYPGDAYVDIVGRDVYSSDPETLAAQEWSLVQAAFNGRKLAALTESGTLPDMLDATDRGVWWSWFSIWEGSFIRNVDPARLSRIYNSDVVLTRDELPDWRTYVLPSAGEGGPEATTAVALFPNPTRTGRATVRVSLAEGADVRVDVYDLTGRLVQTVALGRQPAGPLDVPVGVSGPSGTYLVRVVAGGEVSHARMTVVR